MLKEANAAKAKARYVSAVVTRTSDRHFVVGFGLDSWDGEGNFLFKLDLLQLANFFSVRLV